MYSDLFNSGLMAFDKVREILRGAKTTSLIDFTQVARVEPIVLIDQDVVHSESIGDVQQSLLAIFSGYYMQAAALTNTIGGIKVTRRLEALNPSRNAGDSLINGNSWMLSAEAFADRLPFPGDKALQLSVESISDAPAYLDPKMRLGKSDALDTVQKLNANGGGSVAMSKTDIGKTLNELANLSVGKMYGVDVAEGDNKATLQVSIRLIATGMRTEDLVHILSTGSADDSWKERWHGLKSSQLTFWKDLVLCQDIISQHRRDLINDPSGIRSKLNKVQRGNQLATLVTGRPTISSSSNMVVISKNTADKLELQLEGKLSNFKIRERMFDKTYIMIMAVIDEDFQRVTFYHRGLPLPTDVRLKDLKTSNKGNGPDVSEILKAYQLGNAPSL